MTSSSATPKPSISPLVQKLGGQVIRISPVSTDYINPLDINTNYSEEENPLTLKSDFILSMCELIVGGKDGLQPVEKTIIDRSVRMVYQEFLADPKPEKMPILEDLYNILRNQKEPEAQRIATALENLCSRLSERLQSQNQNVWMSTTALSAMTSANSAATQKARYADRAGSGVEQSYPQPRPAQGNATTW